MTLLSGSDFEDAGCADTGLHFVLSPLVFLSLVGPMSAPSVCNVALSLRLQHGNNQRFLQRGYGWLPSVSSPGLARVVQLSDGACLKWFFHKVLTIPAIYKKHAMHAHHTLYIILLCIGNVFHNDLSFLRYRYFSIFKFSV